MSNTALENPDFRINRAFIPGTMIYVARFGTTKTSGGPVVSLTSKPTFPDPREGGGLEPEFPWLSLGKIRTSQIVPERKQLRAEGVGNQGILSSPDLSIVTGYAIRFSTNWTVPETYELLFGAEGQLANDNTVRGFVTSGTVKVWLCGTQYDLNADRAVLLQYMAPGVLRLSDTPTHQTDITTNSFEMTVEDSPLTSIDPVNIQAGSYDIDNETGAPIHTQSPFPIPNN